MTDAEKWVKKFEAEKEAEMRRVYERTERVMSEVKEQNRSMAFNLGLTDKQYELALQYVKQMHWSLKKAVKTVRTINLSEIELEKNYGALRRQTDSSGEGPRKKLTKDESKRINLLTARPQRKKHVPTKEELAARTWWVVSEYSFPDRYPENVVEQIFEDVEEGIENSDHGLITELVNERRSLAEVAKLRRKR